MRKSLFNTVLTTETDKQSLRLVQGPPSNSEPDCLEDNLALKWPLQWAPFSW